MSRVIDVNDLAVRLGGRLVLHDVRLHVERGELVGLVGPNGAGKTTLLRTVLGLLPSACGHILVDGKRAQAGATQIGYVPQRHEIAWDFPIAVEDFVMTGRTGALGLLRRPGASDWQAVAGALERTRMVDLRQRPVGELSGGQRQRVLVARALALESAALLLDEPFTGLDMPTQELLSRLLASIAREGRAVLMTTHDIPAALIACDRLALLNRTSIAAGSAAELAADPQLWTRTFGVGQDSPLLRVIMAAV